MNSIDNLCLDHGIHIQVINKRSILHMLLSFTLLLSINRHTIRKDTFNNTMNKNSKDLTWSAIRKLLQITELSNSSNCRESKERVLWGVAGRWKDFQRKEGEGTQIKENTGGTWEDSVAVAVAARRQGPLRGKRGKSTFQSRNKPGNIAQISHGGQVRHVTGKIEDEGRRRGGKAEESETMREREIKRRW